MVPDSVTVIRDGAFAFALQNGDDCHINIPQYVVFIGDNAYSNMKNALPTVLNLPDTLEYLYAASAFAGINISEVHFPTGKLLTFSAWLGLGWDSAYQLDVPDYVTRFDAQAYVAQTGSEEKLIARANVPGDLNQDGKVDIADVILLNRYISEDETLQLTAAGIAAADMDGNGMLNGNDSAILMRQLAKLA